MLFILMGKFANFPNKHLHRASSHSNFRHCNISKLMSMKNYLRLAKALFCLTPVLFFSECSSDSELYSEKSTYLTGNRNIIISPYDNNMGKAYDSIYREYRSMYTDTASTSLIIKRIEGIAERIVVLEPYLQIEEAAVEDIISRSISLKDYADVVLSPEAQIILLDFLGSLDGMSDNDIYAAALDFEEIILNTSLGQSSTGILLTVASVIKQHTENGDDDWANQGTTITKAILYGSAENSSKAVVMAVVVRLIREGYREHYLNLIMTNF